MILFLGLSWLYVNGFGSALNRSNWGYSRLTKASVSTWETKPVINVLKKMCVVDVNDLIHSTKPCNISYSGISTMALFALYWLKASSNLLFLVSYQLNSQVLVAQIAHGSLTAETIYICHSEPKIQVIDLRFFILDGYYILNDVLIQKKGRTVHHGV